MKHGDIYNIKVLTAKKSERYLVTDVGYGDMVLRKVMLSKTKIGNIRHPEIMTITLIGNAMIEKRKTKLLKSK